MRFLCFCVFLSGDKRRARCAAEMNRLLQHIFHHWFFQASVTAATPVAQIIGLFIVWCFLLLV